MSTWCGEWCGKWCGKWCGNLITSMVVALLGISPAVAAESGSTEGQRVADSQAEWFDKYKKQNNVPKGDEIALTLVNTDPEPQLTAEFIDLYNGTDLTGWVSRGGECTFEAQGEAILGTCVKGSPSTYLCTERTDYGDFIFTCEIKWLIDNNTGVMFRSDVKPNKKGGETVFGPQVEMEGLEKGRGWSGGIYGQSCGGYFYPLWLDSHEEVRGALVDDWNRVTIHAQGESVKTWVNGVPASNWTTDKYLTGYIGLQVHSGNKGEILFRNIKIKELN